EIVRIMEQEFPGFVARHGNFFSQNKIGQTVAFNAFLRLKSTKDDLSQKTGDMVHDESLVSSVFGGMQSSVESAHNNATATVFTPNAVAWDEAKLHKFASDRAS